MGHQFTIYFGGSLFNHKDLTGNALLAKYIEKLSGNKYRCCLPQNVEQHQTTALDIRNKDLVKIIECDLGLFNFDGTELDAGVVVEFMLAKFLDIPTVILRSDFRTCGEKEIGGEDWNFMCSFYPRTQVVKFNSIQLYQETIEEGRSLNETLDMYYTAIARKVIEGLELVRTERSLLKDDQKRLEILYQWALTFPGGEIEKMVSGPSFVNRLVDGKIRKGLA